MEIAVIERLILVKLMLFLYNPRHKFLLPPFFTSWGP